MDRRSFGKLAVGGIGMLALTNAKGAWALVVPAVDPLIKSDAEWKKQLTAEQYHILREEGTERAFSSKLTDEHRAGTFACIACDLPLFTSDKKFDSGTGWPSFFDAIPTHLAMKTDNSLGMTRTEYHCARCGGHHGHRFTDGPKPTGLRYCNNGAVLKFTPTAT